jgi:hypothetical protein
VDFRAIGPLSATLARRDMTKTHQALQFTHCRIPPTSSFRASIEHASALQTGADRTADRVLGSVALCAVEAESTHMARGRFDTAHQRLGLATNCRSPAPSGDVQLRSLLIQLADYATEHRGGLDPVLKIADRRSRRPSSSPQTPSQTLDGEPCRVQTHARQ